MGGVHRPGLRGFEFIRSCLRHEAAGGVLLLMSAVLALVFSNTALRGAYNAFLEMPATVRIGEFAIDKPLLLWINDGLMAIFFFLVGLEIKREVLEGKLSSRKEAALPVIAAIGGMVAPAIVYYLLNAGDPVATRGWAIPAATDIAFALGILMLLGPRVPVALKVFLLALAIIDDLGAIIIIALFYTEQLSVPVLSVALVGLAGLALLNRNKVSSLAPYVLIGLGVWVFVLKSGVHATLAGVVVALFVPLKAEGEAERSPLKRAEHALVPWVAFGVIPAFAFANAGVYLGDLTVAALVAPVPLGIALGLFIGKQIGIMGSVWLAVKSGLATLPKDVTWLQLYGVSLLAGIGFTMSLFIGTLAFSGPDYAVAVRLGVLTGSFLSAVAGVVVLRYALRENASEVAVPA
ncbi:MAG: Na+/H+ antiporter NhaA [Beijerinckiaceae bacterium]